MDLATSNIQDYDLHNLHGELVSVWPYMRGYFAADLPYQIWATMVKEDALKLVFFEQPDSPTPIPVYADLTYFCEFMADPKKIFLLVTSAENQELAGLIWFDGIVANCRGSANYWFRRKYWGNATREACKIGMDYCFNFLKWESIWGYTPWMTSVKTTNAIGFEYVTKIPQATKALGKMRDIHVSVMKKENYHGRWG